MIPSNILNIFGQSENSKPVSSEEDCFTCQILGSVTALAAGLYFASGYVFKGDLNYKQSPLWWRYSVRGAGVVLLCMGGYRGGEGWLWGTSKKYKNTFY